MGCGLMESGLRSLHHIFQSQMISRTYLIYCCHYQHQSIMGCCSSCLNSCCCTEAGLRCHSVISICGFVYFLLMFLLFERQKHFFEFTIPDQEGTKWALLATAGIWLLLFFVCIGKLSKLTDQQVPGTEKNRVTVFDVKASREGPYQAKSEEVRPLRQPE